MDPLLGKTLSHYLIIEQIGAGGMGAVYRARDERLDRDVAVKVLPSGALADEASRRRFRREALTLSKLNHPHVATVYDFDSHDGVDFLVMEYVSGVSLDKRLASGALSEKEVARLGSQLAQGLTAAHAVGIIHRDLKPGNLRITTDSRLKILDFGLAKALHPERLDRTATTETGVIAGTLPYMSPEQLRGERPDQRSDIYSAGVVLYEAATGRRAFPQSQAAQLIDAILREAPPPPRQLNPQISTALDGIIVKAMDKDSDLRYHAARELGVDLERLTMPVLHTRARREKTSSWRWGLIAGGVVIAILAFFWSVTLQRYWRLGRSPAVPIQRQITYLGNVGTCDLSPDGRTIAYTIPDSGGSVGQKVVVQDIGGGAPLTVFREKDCARLQWSPDGTEILVNSGPDGAYGIYIVPRLGGQARHYRAASTSTWSPDGARIASAMLMDKRIRLVDKASGDSSFVPLQGSFDWLLGVDWCPVGDRLLVETVDSSGDPTLWTVSTRGGEQQKVLQDSTKIWGATWSTRGDAIRYFRSSEGEGDNLLKIRIDPKRGTPIGRPTVLLTGLYVDASSISRGGRKLAYTRSLTYSNLWRLTWEGGGQATRFRTEPITSGTANNRNPDVSPAGDRVVFVRERPEGSNLWTISARGGDPYQVTSGIRWVGNPVWSPDGSRIAFAGEQGGAQRVWVVDADGRMPHCYSQTLVSPGVPLTWSRTKGILYDAPGNRRIDALDPETGRIWRLIPEGALGWVFYPQVSPDGGRVALATNYGLYVVDAGDPSKVLLRVKNPLVPLAWTRDGRKVFAFSPMPPLRILEISAESGVAVPLPAPQLPGEIAVTGLSAGPNGRTFVCAASQSVSDVVIVDGFDPEAR